jgi:hypothetical protein
MSSNQNEGSHKESRHSSPYSSLYSSDNTNFSSNQPSESSYISQTPSQLANASTQLYSQQKNVPGQSEKEAALPKPTSNETDWNKYSNVIEQQNAVRKLILLQNMYFHLAFRDPEILPKEKRAEFKRMNFLSIITKFSFLIFFIVKTRKFVPSENNLRKFLFYFMGFFVISIYTSALTKSVSDKAFQMNYGSMSLQQIEEELKMLKQNQVVVKY